MRQVQGVALVALASAAVAGLALEFGDPLLPRWSPLAASELAPPVLAAAAGVVFFLAALLVATSFRLRRRRQQTASTVGSLPVADGEADSAEQVTDVRVLHAQIRTLEEALENETALVREPSPTPTPEGVGDEAVEELRRRIRSTVRGLAVRMEDDPTAAHVLARVEAALNRLMTPTEPFVRPTLTVARQVPVPSTGTPAALDPALNAVREIAPVREIAVEVAVAEVVAPETSSTHTPSTEMSNAEVPIPEARYAAPVLAPPLDEEVVLPIPARTPSPQIRRGRRWLRGSAA